MFGLAQMATRRAASERSDSVSPPPIEANDEWLVGRAYISPKSMAPLFAPRTETTITTNNDQKEVGELLAA